MIGRDFLESYVNDGQPMVVEIPNYIKMLGGRCVRIRVKKINSWRVRVTFKSSNDISYEAISTHMCNLLDQPVLDSGILFERYPVAKKCLEGLTLK